MNDNEWKMADFYKYVKECFILEDKQRPMEGKVLKDYEDSNKRQIRRTIEKDLILDRDYTKKGEQYSMTISNAKKFINTNKKIRKYFYDQMTKDGKLLADYFSKEDAKKNLEHAQKLGDYYQNYRSLEELEQQEPLKLDEVESEMLDYLFALYFNSSIQEVFHYLKIDGEAFKAGFQELKSLTVEADSMPYLDGFSYLEFKLKHPTIYYSSDK